MATRWQQLGAFVAEADKITDDRLRLFYRAGGRWLVVLLDQLGYPHDHDPAVVRNHLLMPSFKDRCTQQGIACGAWFNGWAGGPLNWTAAQQAEQIEALVRRWNLGPVVLDLEAPYMFPGGRPQELPRLVWEVRQRLKTRAVGVSTNSLNDSMIWNGGELGPAASLRRLGVAVLPQTYGPPLYTSDWMNAAPLMRWLKANGMNDNFHDPTFRGGRAVALSSVKPTLEATGMEGCDLAAELESVAAAKQYGFKFGISLYTLEGAPDSDFPLLAARRGSLFLA